jgi:hypothetical protein
MFNHGGITYLHEQYDAPAGQRYIWPVPDSFGLRDQTIYGFEVIHERRLRFGAKAYELAGLHTSLLNAVITVGNPDRDAWIAHSALYEFFDDPDNQAPSPNSTYFMRALNALDTLMLDATSTEEPFIERSRRGSGSHMKFRLNPLIGIEDRRSPRDFDVPFD